MPEISLFYGIRITMNYSEHNPPHIHIQYAELGVSKRWKATKQSESINLKKGMVSSMDATFYPIVYQVLPNEDYTVYVYFNDGSVRLYDVAPLLEKGTVFEKLLDFHVFKEKIAVMNGTLAWDIDGNRNEYTCIDIDPFTVFNSPIVEDPLGKQGEIESCDGKYK